MSLTNLQNSQETNCTAVYSGPVILLKRDSNIGAFFPVKFAIYRALPGGCFWMLYDWGFLTGAKPNPDSARSVIALYCFFGTIVLTVVI